MELVSFFSLLQSEVLVKFWSDACIGMFCTLATHNTVSLCFSCLCPGFFFFLSPIWNNNGTRMNNKQQYAMQTLFIPFLLFCMESVDGVSHSRMQKCWNLCFKVLIFQAHIKVLPIIFALASFIWYHFESGMKKRAKNVENEKLFIFLCTRSTNVFYTCHSEEYWPFVHLQSMLMRFFFILFIM